MSEAVGRVVVEVSTAELDLGAAWRDLAGRAAPNVFMDPVMTNAARAAGFSETVVLTAWDQASTPARLVGMWVLRRAAVTPIGPAFLAGPPNDYAFVSNPVIDRAHLDTVMAIFLETVAREPSLPKVIRLRYLDAGAETYPALVRAAEARGATAAILGGRERAYALRGAATKATGVTRRKLGQQRRRLEAKGAVSFRNERSPERAKAAFEDFLALEATSWKADRGTALLSDAGSAQFARTFFAGLAAEERASVALLTLDGKAIAALAMLYDGAVAYTWKVAFDPREGRNSPGALLSDSVTETMLANEGIAEIDSCSPEPGYLERLWTGRRLTVDLLIDVGPRKSPTFTLVAMRVRGHIALRSIRDRVRGWLSRRGTKAADG